MMEHDKFSRFSTSSETVAATHTVFPVEPIETYVSHTVFPVDPIDHVVTHTVFPVEPIGSVDQAENDVTARDYKNATRPRRSMTTDSGYEDGSRREECESGFYDDSSDDDDLSPVTPHGSVDDDDTGVSIVHPRNTEQNNLNNRKLAQGENNGSTTEELPLYTKEGAIEALKELLGTSKESAEDINAVNPLIDIAANIVIKVTDIEGVESYFTLKRDVKPPPPPPAPVDVPAPTPAPAPAPIQQQWRSGRSMMNRNAAANLGSSCHRPTTA